MAFHQYVTFSLTFDNTLSNFMQDSDFGSEPFTPSMANAMDAVSIQAYSRAPKPKLPLWASQPTLASQSTPRPIPRPSLRPTPRPIPHPLTTSLPYSGPTAPNIQQRQQLTLGHMRTRLEKSASLDVYMPMVQGSCPIDFAITGSLKKHQAFSGCSLHASVIPPPGWIEYKKIFSWKPFSYCYWCGLPQDCNNNGESPDCHRRLIWTKGVPCAFAGFTYIVVWTLWHTPTSRAALIDHFGLPRSMTYQDFCQWATREDDGEYYKGLEVFLWYCKRWLESGRR